jgi:CO/xanthine dehydrogenase Mo-binding subunit
MAEPRAVGRRMLRIDAREKVKGEAIFGADVTLPGSLVGKLLRSPQAHAEILSIDTSRAEALPGVAAVVTAADIPLVSTYNRGSRAHAFLARKFAVFAGQPVAGVAAENTEIAEAALDLIEVSYRLMPVISKLDDALAPGSFPVSHTDTVPESPQGEQFTPNISYSETFAHGDLEAAFGRSDIVLENTYFSPVTHQGYIEPHAVSAFWDRPGHVTVWECVQGTFGAREMISNVLGIPLSQITVNSTEIGGAFGGKNTGMYAAVTVLLAKKAGRPVKLVMTRREELSAANPAPRSRICIKTGAKKDGTLTAIEAGVVVDAGAFSQSWITSIVAESLRDSYKFEAWKINGVEVLTNKASIAPYRAPGMPNVSFAIESQIDAMAHRLSLDPLEFRLKNLVQEGDLLSNGNPEVQVGSREVLLALKEHGVWDPSKPLPARSDGWLAGRGLALGGWDGAHGPAGALAYLEAGGTFRIVLGTVDVTGAFTSLAQIAAEALGVSPERILIHKASPDTAPYAPISAGSQTIIAMGEAVRLAASDLRKHMLEFAASNLRVMPGDLVVDDDGIFVHANPQERATFEMLYILATEWEGAAGPLIGTGSAPVRKRAPGCAACAVEVAVDPLTGRVKLTRLVSAQDVGRAINPLSIEGQMQGASLQSAGIALWEEILYTPDGQLLNPSLLDYRTPTAADAPSIETIILEVPGGDGPFGAKCVGEPAMIPPIAAIANAISDAIGARVLELPATPERVWRMLKNK